MTPETFAQLKASESEGWPQLRKVTPRLTVEAKVRAIAAFIDAELDRVPRRDLDVALKATGWDERMCNVARAALPLVEKDRERT